jgi:thioredoxin 1
LSNIREISANSFSKEVLHVEEPVIVEFFSHSCPHCIKFDPAYAHLAEALDGQALFFKIDVLRSGANRTLAHRRGVRTVPTLEIFYRGRVIGSMVGYHEVKKLVPTVKKFLSEKEENIGPGTHLADA